MDLEDRSARDAYTPGGEFRIGDTKFEAEPVRRRAKKAEATADEVVEVREAALRDAPEVKRLDAEVKGCAASVKTSQEAYVRAIFARAKFIASTKPNKYGLEAPWREALAAESGVSAATIEKDVWRAQATDKQIEKAAKTCKTQKQVDDLLRVETEKKRKQPAEKAPVVLAAITGTNADLMVNAWALYAPPAGSKVADFTYGKGVFWQRIDLSGHQFLPSDIKRNPEAPADVEILECDFANLPYEDGSLAMAVLDPPYVPDPHTGMAFDASYQNIDTTTAHSMEDIRALYSIGIRSALRCLAPDGVLLIKGQDSRNGKMWWNEEWIAREAESMGFEREDKFLLIPEGGAGSVSYSGPQRHARNNYSFLLVLRKPKTTKGGPKKSKTVQAETQQELQRNFQEAEEYIAGLPQEDAPVDAGAAAPPRATIKLLPPGPPPKPKSGAERLLEALASIPAPVPDSDRDIELLIDIDGNEYPPVQTLDQWEETCREVVKEYYHDDWPGRRVSKQQAAGRAYLHAMLICSQPLQRVPKNLILRVGNQVLSMPCLRGEVDSDNHCDVYARLSVRVIRAAIKRAWASGG